MDKLPNKNLDVQQILEKIKNLKIDNKDKATILEEIKKNIMNPSSGENQNLNYIQSKYTSMNMPQGQSRQEANQNMYGQEPYNLMPINTYQNNTNQIQPQFQQMHQQFNPQQRQQLMNIDGSQVMTVAHFDILKNKLDSLQY